MKVLKILAFSLMAIILIAFTVLTVKKVRFDQEQEGINLTGDVRSYPYSSYSISEGKIYYIKPGSGYFLVKGTDAKTFGPLNTAGDRGTMAKDTNHVFFKTNILPNLKPDGFIYLGNNFGKNHDYVFYGNTLLKQADVSSFAFVNGYYATDRKHLYYKQHTVPGADVRSIQVKDDHPGKENFPDEYLMDEKHVYYKGNLIKDAKPGSFKLLVVEDDQWHTQYAFDGEHYFNDQYEISTGRDGLQNRLQLLFLDKGFGWLGIFFQGTAIYCYDTDSHHLVLLGNRDNSTSFRMIDRGIFADDKHIYFTFGKWNSSGSRVPQYTGHTTGICVIEGATPDNFRAAGHWITGGKIEGIIYQCGNQRYFHPARETLGNYHPGLLLLKADGTTKNLPTGDALSGYIKKDDGPSIFSKKFYRDFFKPDSDYRDY
jgi:hypothetical protein